MRTNITNEVSTAQPKLVFIHRFRAHPEVIRSTLIELNQMMKPHIFPDLLHRSELVLAELLNNIAEHGQPEGENSGIFIRMSVASQTDGISCEVRDNGKVLPETCLTAGLPDITAYPENGFGWFLIKQLTQSLAYSRCGRQNVIAFTVPVTPANKT